MEERQVPAGKRGQNIQNTAMAGQAKVASASNTAYDAVGYDLGQL